MAANQTRRILVKVEAQGVKGLDDVSKRLGTLNSTAKSLKSSLGFLTGAFQSWLGFLGVRELTRMSDEMQNVSNRLKIVTGSTEGAQAAMAQLASVADRTNQSISQTGEIYSRLALSLGRSGASTKEVLDLTETLINTFRVAGTTTAETTNTIIQLSQAFASGELRGQELRSVMEQNATLATALRERFGKDIYKKAQEGAISVVEVMKVLASIQQQVNDDAKKLAPTFEQTLTKSMNTVSMAIGKLNEEYEISAKFASVMEVAVGQLGNALTIFATIAVAAAITKLGVLATTLKTLGTKMLAFVAANPMLVIFTAITAAGILLYNNWEKLVGMGKRLKVSFLEVAVSLEEAFMPLREKLFGPNSNIIKNSRESIDAMKSSIKDLRAEIDRPSNTSEAGFVGPKQVENLETLIDKLSKTGGVTEKVDKLKTMLGNLNKLYQSGAIDLAEYNKRLIAFDFYKLRREFAEGKMDIIKFNDQMEKLHMEEYNRQFNTGALSVEEFNQKIFALTSANLDQKLSAGVISLQKYNEEMVKLNQNLNDNAATGNQWLTGVNDYIKSVGTVAQNISKGIQSSFDALETGLTDFIKTGTFNFKNFVQTILDDLTKIILRAMIIRPLAQGILGSWGAGAAAGSTMNYNPSTNLMLAAKGAAFNNGNVIPFAKGGIVDGATPFTFGRGKTGVMGEAGAEAILPLQRSSNGDLGVAAQVTPVTININNQSGAEVTQTESTGPNGEKTIDIMILSRVRDGIAAGKFDNVMSSAYGIRRKGN